ncbi:MAG: hypothetical protein ABI468_07095 [Candidatus Nanopelagicales bacterium]
MSSARSIRAKRWVRWALPVTTAVVIAGGLGAAQAATRTTASTDTPAATTAAMSASAMAAMPNRGQNGFGITNGSFSFGRSQFTYTHGYWCDASVPAASTTQCEVGQIWHYAPSAQHDPLIITVPLGFNVPAMQMDCPSKLVCIDHPATLDLTRLAGALAPIFKTTPAALLPALKNFQTPGHDHFITDKNHHKAEWWDVYVVGVTSPATYKRIHQVGSYSYIEWLQRHHNKNVTATIPTNLFLYFAAK